MYETVVSEEQLSLFNELLNQVYGKRNYIYDEVGRLTENYHLFLIKDIVGQYIGTIEINLYKKEFSENEREFVFSDWIDTKRYKGRIYELGKLTIIDEKQSIVHFKITLEAIANFAYDNNVRYYVALIDRRLFISLKRFCKTGLKKLGEERDYKGHIVVPAIVDCFECAKLTPFSLLQNNRMISD
jgi:hypothetical protein